jgi:2'-5' RNA ligase
VLDAASRDWIETIRAGHDPQALRIAVHFTLVFPVAADAEAIAPEVARVARAQAPFGFAIETIAAVRDAFGHGGHVFLVPSDGAHEIHVLHDRLYAGSLAAHLRDDIPYTPHLTVAAHREFARCEALAAALNSQRPRIAGRIERLTLVEIAAEAITDVRVFALHG